MRKTILAAVVRESGKPLTIEEVPVPDAGPGEVLIKVAARGVCRWGYKRMHMLSSRSSRAPDL